MNLPQILNALTMVSPLWVWFNKRRSHKHLAFHKLLILHIPVSFMYHLLQGIKGLIPISHRLIVIFKVADCAMIHGYTTLCNMGITTYHRMRFTRWESIARRATHCMNISCIVNMVREPKVIDNAMFSILRVVAIGTLSSSTLSHTDQRFAGTLYGTLCALLFMVDSKLADYGHCLFHLALGGLHHTIYKCVDDDKRREISIPMLPLVHD
jgi:hypothetical protein